MWQPLIASVATAIQVVQNGRDAPDEGVVGSHSVNDFFRGALGAPASPKNKVHVPKHFDVLPLETAEKCAPEYQTKASKQRL
jgi:hypothetical protein